MADSKKPAGERKPRAKPRPKYPWLRLLELEQERPDLHPAGEQARAAKPRGRPRNAFPRKKIHITLTEDELQALDGLVGRLSPRIAGLHRGNLIAMLVFYLQESLEGSDPEQVKSFTDIVKILDQEKGER